VGKYKYLIFITLGLTSSPLDGEVQSVVARWTPGRCKESCQERLQEAFAKSDEVESFSVNDANGAATFKWNPDAKFSYRVLKRPMQRVGIGIDSVAVVVRGKIKKVGNHMVLSSDGDGTQFRLVSYDDRKPNPRYLSLDPNLEAQLTSSSDKNQIYVVDGPLYQAHRSPPLYLIVNRVQIEK